MKRGLSKRILVCSFLLLFVLQASARADGAEVAVETAPKKHDLSPEFTAQGYMGFYDNGYR